MASIFKMITTLIKHSFSNFLFCFFCIWLFSSFFFSSCRILLCFPCFSLSLFLSIELSYLLLLSSPFSFFTMIFICTSFNNCSYFFSFSHIFLDYFLIFHSFYFSLLFFYFHSLPFYLSFVCLPFTTNIIFSFSSFF